MKAWLLEITGDDAARAEHALEGLKLYPGDVELLGHISDIDLAFGRAERSRSRWEAAYPSLFDPSVEILIIWLKIG